uniref:hypothetical protein n=1 Tax=Variovorax boronicumulans TaxID=436515 RepID=UPI00358FF5C1
MLSETGCKLAFMHYGERLQLALELARKDRNALGKELGISVQAIGQAIRGGRTGTQMFNAENSAKAARFLAVDHYWLATGDGVPRPDNLIPDDALEFAKQFAQLTENEKAKLRALFAVVRSEPPSGAATSEKKPGRK